MYESPLDTVKMVAKYLGEPLPREKGLLQEHLIGLEATRFELAKKVVEWKRLLHEKENQMLHPKDSNLTELDRKTMLNASVAVIKQDADLLEKLETLIEQRLQLGKLFLSL